MSDNWREFIACLDPSIDEDGVGSISLDDLTLEDLNVRPHMGPELRHHLPIFATGEEIIQVHEQAKTNPNIMFAVRGDDAPTDPQGTGKDADACQCRACQEKSKKKD